MKKVKENTVYFIQHMNVCIRRSTAVSMFALFVVVGLFFSGVPTVLAQMFSGETIIQKAHLEVDPRYPTPGEMVKVTLLAPTVDMESSIVTWTVNGKVVQQSYAGKQLTVPAGEVGSTLSIRVTAESPKGERVSADTSIRVSDATILWEGKTYTPVFFAGRALYTPGSEVTFSALPLVTDTSKHFYNKDDLIYVWRIKGNSMPLASGKGKHTVTLINKNEFLPFEIYLEIKDPQGNMRVSKKLSVPVSQPELQLYEDSPIVGIYYGRALGATFGVYSGESTVIAEPYYMSASSRVDPVLVYGWEVSGNEYSAPGALKFGSEGDGLQSTMLKLSVKNDAFWLQSARIEKRIDFGERSTWRETSSETTPL